MVYNTQNYRAGGLLDKVHNPSNPFKVFLTFNVVPGMAINHTVFIEKSFYYFAT